MGCACKVNRQISYLEKHYGTERFSGDNKKKKHLFNNFSLWRTLVVMITLPLMLLFGLFVLPFRNKPIKINKLVKVRV